MKILTISFLTCAVKSCRSSPLSFPLHLRDAQLEKLSISYNSQFLRNILPRIDWVALQTTSAELGLTTLLPHDGSNPQDALLQEQEQGQVGSGDADANANIDMEQKQGSRQESGVDEATLRKLWTLLMETSVAEGKLVCGNCGFEYPVKEGVGNFLLPPHLV